MIKCQECDKEINPEDKTNGVVKDFWGNAIGFVHQKCFNKGLRESKRHE